MPWKTEIDRLVHHLVLDAGQGGRSDLRRAVRTVSDLAGLAPDREPTQFHLGALEEVMGPRPDEAEESGAEDLVEALPEAKTEAGRRWRLLGRLDAASRAGTRERVRELMEDPAFEVCLDHPEGRVALRAVGRMLLRDGETERVFDYYRRHLAAVDDEGSRRDAEFLLEESLRRADRGDVPEDEVLARLGRAAAFAEDGGLDARARSKVDRKTGRLHQLAGRAEDATACYRRALERLPEDDPYRSVLVGDLALATLGVRGTLDLLPVPDRDNRAAALEILESGLGGEGRSYNAIYTRGLLAYETADWTRAAEAFREADQLMRENRAKARIVHARSRFFLGHCLLASGAADEEIEQVQRWVLRNAGAVSLDPELKEPVFDALVERVPGARIPGRASDRAAQPSRSAATHLGAAREKLADDPHAALRLVDKAFKSRPDFETWFGAYGTRLKALAALEERDEALRTFERFRAKLLHREALAPLEGLLLDEEGPVRAVLDQAALDEELAGLYEVMPEREAKFLEVARSLADRYLESGEGERIARALGLLGELAARDAEGTSERLAEAKEAAQAAGVLGAAVDHEETKSLLKDEEDPVRVVVVGGEKAHQALVGRFHALADELGFEGQWVFTGVRPPYKTLREIASHVQDADAVLMHHAVGADMREEVKRIGEKYDVPVRQAPWLGAASLEDEVLEALSSAFVE
ncbi:MAG: hypothetical protein ACC662_01645 [Planctomycetota bacterium]